jgi:predicted transcriptional regulator
MQPYALRIRIGVLNQIGSVVTAIATALQKASQQISGQATPETTNGSTPAEKATPAVLVRASVRPDYLVCLECGTKQKTLKRHLGVAHSLSPAEYRGKWNLKKDYPMSAPKYSETRSAMAKKIGLGAKERGRGVGKSRRQPRPRKFFRDRRRASRPSREDSIERRCRRDRQRTRSLCVQQRPGPPGQVYAVIFPYPIIDL